MTEVHWQKGEARIFDSTVYYTAPKVIITVPPSLIKESESKNSIIFFPRIPDKIDAFRKIGYGNVIKFSLQFSEAFWKNEAIEKRLGKSLDKLGFLLSDAEVPTWWTQLPYPVPILTGWFA